MAREFPYPPRMMTRARAAHYCDLSEAAFEREVAAGKLPPSVMLGGKEHWSRVALDDYLARLAGESVGDWRKDQPLYAA
jgi:predicted DNA-binding transcriptional regulator AlpA